MHEHAYKDVPTDPDRQQLPHAPAQRSWLGGSEVIERQVRLRLGATLLAAQLTDFEQARGPGRVPVWQRFLAAWDGER